MATAHEGPWHHLRYHRSQYFPPTANTKKGPNDFTDVSVVAGEGENRKPKPENNISGLGSEM